jgi:hypothetical protein
MNVHVEPLGQPAPGTAKPGNLYADLQTRSLWLGVDPAVVSSGSVLISDMVALMAEIAQTEADAKLYTDTQLLPYAKIADQIFTGNPRAPTPLATDNDTSIATTAFVKTALGTSSTAKERRYTVLMFAGNPADIGSGDWAGWALCDGTAYPNQPALPPASGLVTVTTPDLRSKFILGSGHIPQWPLAGSNNPLATAPTTPAGAHTPTASASSIALTLAQIPSHSHPTPTLYGQIYSASTDTEAAHQHYAGDAVLGGSGGGSGLRAYTARWYSRLHHGGGLALACCQWLLLRRRQ